MTTQTYTVTGMTCGHCANAITDEVSALDGVDAVIVDLETGQLSITSQVPVDLSVIAAAVDEAGDYTVS